MRESLLLHCNKFLSFPIMQRNISPARRQARAFVSHAHLGDFLLNLGRSANSGAAPSPCSRSVPDVARTAIDGAVKIALVHFSDLCFTKQIN